MLKMVKTLLPALLIAALPAQVRAGTGHGTIRETDTQIIIEYTGDAADKPADSKAAGQPGPQQQAPASTAPAGQAAGDNGGATTQQQDEARRKQEEARGAARSGRSRGASPSRGSRATSGSDNPE